MKTQKKNGIAPESKKTQKAREKLLKQKEEIQKIITEEALKKKSEEIHLWIGRHSESRITLKNKNISLFDENQNSASFSQRIFSISRELSEQMKPISFHLQNEDRVSS